MPIKVLVRGLFAVWVMLAGGAATAQAAGDRPTAVIQVAAASNGKIREIRVEGVQRIEAATVRSYLTLAPGDRFDSVRIDESLKALYGTGLFADVTMTRVGNALVVKVVENLIINSIAFEGNRLLAADALRAEIQLRPRVVYTRTRVQNDVQRIIDAYRRHGRFAATVEPKIIKLDQSRVDLVFAVNEGTRTGVHSITFIGNGHVGDAVLREQISTRESAFWRSLLSGDIYDPDRLADDRERLRRYYLKEGYADFRVVSAVAELAPGRQAFLITFTIEEGERYTFGKIDIGNTLKSLDAGTLKGIVTTSEGAWYDAQEVENTIAGLISIGQDLGSAFVDVRPRITRNRDTRTIDVTYEITEGPRVFIERIDIIGNLRTMDKFIRREMLVAEGDPCTAVKLRRSEQRIMGLGRFETVTITAEKGSAPDHAVVVVSVRERSAALLPWLQE